MGNRLLFVSSHRAEPGAIAVAIARSMAGSGWELSYACPESRELDPALAGMLAPHGLELPSDPPRHPEALQQIPFDAVVTFCESSVRACPTFPGLPARFHWPLDEMVEGGYDGLGPQQLASLVELLHERVRALFEHGTLDVVLQIRETFGSLLDNLTDGVLAHDAKRRIFAFNRAAEQITGYPAEELIGRDCHDVFPGLFCGGGCSFCSGQVQQDQRLRYPAKFVSRSGELLDLEMSAVNLHTQGSASRGSMIIFRDLTEVNQLRRSLQRREGFHGIVGASAAMQDLYATITELADEQVPVLITGESGTGKELVAEALHNASKRAGKPFVPVNCGALPEGVIESELFGHVRGAFTGAIRDKRGRFELARGGTLFLDEIGEISPALQVKLLRAIETGRYEPVGGERTEQADVRIVCATNRDLRAEVAAGRFREDLYYRLAVYPVELPPLRERAEDVDLLVDHFVELYGSEVGRPSAGLSDEAREVLRNQRWPGNVRQLANAIQQALIRCRGGRIEPQHLPPELLASAEQRVSRTGRPPKLDEERVRAALAQAGGNRARAARELGVARSTLYRYLDEIGV